MTITTNTLAPVRQQIVVPLAPADAFALFTEAIDRWWPFAGHSCFGDEALTVEFEPRDGGQVSEVARDGRRMPWGVLTQWSPPGGFAMRWHPGLDASEATLLQVRFEPTADGQTTVSIHHDGWEARGPTAAEKRGQYEGGWVAVLGLYRQQALASGAPR
jgi:uncharacterized protein YndB with AHSA1/START domain